MNGERVGGWKEISKYCGYSETYLKRNWKMWKLPVYKHNGRRMAKKKDLDNWLSKPQ